MDEKLFGELVKSIKQAGAIKRGEATPSRSYTLSPPRVRKIRQQTKLSQDSFATFIGVSVGTLRNWEQGRRNPSGAAKALLNAIENDPVNVIKALHPEVMK